MCICICVSLFFYIFLQNESPTQPVPAPRPWNLPHLLGCFDEEPRWAVDRIPPVDAMVRIHCNLSSMPWVTFCYSRGFPPQEKAWESYETYELFISLWGWRIFQSCPTWSFKNWQAYIQGFLNGFPRYLLYFIISIYILERFAMRLLRIILRHSDPLPWRIHRQCI
jgi:hypothetical protein